MKKRPDQAQDFEINLAAIIDCLTVLLIYLLVSTSFLTLGVLDVAVATPGPTSGSGVLAPVSVSILLHQDRHMTIDVSGAVQETIRIPAKTYTWDFAVLEGHLRAFKERWVELNSAILSAEATIEYKEVIRAVESGRRVFPVILLGDHR